MNSYNQSNVQADQYMFTPNSSNDQIAYQHQAAMTPEQVQSRKSNIKDNIELLSHQQKLQMHLLEAAQYRKRYQ